MNESGIFLKAEVYVASHKKTRMPNDPMYYPLQVGTNLENFEGYLRDNVGENIAHKNSNYSELTAQYWAANNRHADIKGMVHYRRLFSNGKINFFSNINQKYNDVMTFKTLETIFAKYDMILPKKRHYYIESSWSHYEHIHHIKDMEITRAVLLDKYPDYVPLFDKIVKRSSAHMFNMFIARSTIFDTYTRWLMDILSGVEEQADISSYTPYERRIYGFISELLLDVWVEKNNINYCEVPVMFMGNQHWVKKIGSFVMRKVRGGTQD